MIAEVLLLLLQAGSLTGTVRAEGTRQPVPHATVEIPQLSRRVASDREGRFEIPQVPAGDWQLHVTAPGFIRFVTEVRVVEAGSVRLDVELAREAVEVAGIEVRSRTGSGAAAQAGTSSWRLDPRQIHATPALAEVDVLRTVQTLPSVSAVSDFSSALYVRGGSPDQTMVRLDGVPLFNPYHLGGIFAAIDPDAVASVDLLAGAMPARAGDRLSGIVDIRTRTGSRDSTHASGSIGLLSSRATVDGPLPGARGSYLFSIRRTYVDLLTDLAHRIGMIPVTVPYAFTDGHLKVTHDVGATGSLAASMYVDSEGVHVPPTMDVSEDAEWAWGSRAVSLSYRQSLGRAVLADLRAGYSSFGGSFRMRPQGASRPGEQLADPPGSRTLDASTSIGNLITAADLTWYRGSHVVRAGVQADRYRFAHDVSVRYEELRPYFPDFSSHDGSWTVAAYAEDEWRPVPGLQLRAGVRTLSLGARHTEWMPRAGARLEISPRLSLFAGGGRYAQSLYSIRDEESLFTSLMAYDFFAPVPENLKLAAGYDVVGGLEWQSGATLVRLEAYAKRLERIPVTPVPAEPLFAPVLVPDEARRGEGSAHGTELLLRHGSENGGVSLSYALALAERDVDGHRFTPRFDRRHRVDLMGHARIGARGNMSVRLLWATGQPYTPGVSETSRMTYDPLTGTFVTGPGSVVLGEHNSARLPNYLRLDIAARKSFDRKWLGRTTTLTPYLQVLNVLNARNPLLGEPVPSVGAQRPELKLTGQLPILPTVGIDWRF